MSLAFYVQMTKEEATSFKNFNTSPTSLKLSNDVFGPFELAVVSDLFEEKNLLFSGKQKLKENLFLYF